MEIAAVSKLKACLSAYLLKVKAGQEILVTDRGKPVARLVPYIAEGSRSERMDHLAKSGIVRLPTCSVPPRLLEQGPRARMSSKSVLTALLEEREAGR